MSASAARARLGLLLWGALPGVVHAQAVADAGTYRIYQGTAELGRESFRQSGDSLNQTITVPLANLHLTALTTRRPDGALGSFEMRVRNAAGDSVRGMQRVQRTGDSLEITSEFGRSSRRATRLAGPLLVVPPQSVGIFGEVARLAMGRDTTLALLVASADTVLPASVRFARDTVRISFAGLEIIGRFEGGVLTELSVPLQRVRAIRAAPGESLPPLAGLRRPTPNYAPPAGAEWTAEAVRVAVGVAPDSFSLACTFTRPARGKGPYPAAITITGSGFQTRDEDLWPLLPDYRLFGEVAERLTANGVAVLRCDDRGIGGSGGRPDSATSADLAGDTRAQVAWLRGRREVDPRRIALIGHSEGGIIGPLVAAEDRQLAALVLLAAPAKNGTEILVDQMQWPVRTAPGLTARERDSALQSAERGVREGAQARSPWLSWFLQYEPLPTIRRLRLPVLILQGALDRQVTAGQADTLAAALRSAGNRRTEVEVFPGLNHLFLPALVDGSPSEYPALPDRRIPGEMLDRLSEWLTRVLRAPGPP